MNPKRIILWVASHLLVIVAAVLLARRSTSDPVSGVAADAPRRQQETSGHVGTESRDASLRPASQWRGSEFARAWKAVRTAKLTTNERLKTQRGLLEQWAKVDLIAAIEAALGEEWDGEESMFSDLDGPYLDVFGDAFAENSEESWEIIRSKRFGLATGMLRNVWIESVGWKNPLALAGKFGELSWRDRENAIAAASNGTWESDITNEKRAEIFNILKQLPADVLSDEQLVSFVPESTHETDLAQLKSEILGLGGDDARMARVKAFALGSRLAMKSDLNLVEQLHDLPPELKAAAAWGAFENPNNKQMLEAADILVECQAWDRFEESDMVSQMRRLCQDGQSDEVADWAAGMPFRKETSELFHRCVETYLRENMADSREWIAGIETPEWRDRAYAEYSQQALNAHGDPEASRWALNQIKDLGFKSEAESWRASWERRNGRKSD